MWNHVCLAPEDCILDTKIDDDKGIRNEQQLRYSKGLWWQPDMSSYVYYRPTHWKFPWKK